MDWIARISGVFVVAGDPKVTIYVFLILWVGPGMGTLDESRLHDGHLLGCLCLAGWWVGTA